MDCFTASKNIWSIKIGLESAECSGWWHRNRKTKEKSCDTHFHQKLEWIGRNFIIFAMQWHVFYIAYTNEWNSVSSVSLSVLLWHSYVHVSLVSSSNDSLSRPNHVQNVAHTRTHARTQIEFRNLISKGVKWWAKSWTQLCFLLLSLSLYLIWNVSTRLTTHMAFVEMTFCHSLPFQFPRKNTKGIPILYSNSNRNRDIHQMEHQK